MRKLLLNTLVLLSLSAGFVSCNDDELGPTIFPHISEDLDKNSATYPLDKFLYDNYLIPYNMKFDYRMQDIESNMDYNLVPASYEKSIDMAVLIKYLWYDVYNKIVENSTSEAADKFFLKRYGPKMIMLVGSSAYNESSHTEELGVAEGGVKISLMAVNRLDINDIAGMNEYYFRVMHHEFSHILHQTILFSEDFGKISSGRYDSMNWQDKEELVVRTQGFITPYASKDYNEDFVETIANYVVSTDEQWAEFMDQASYDYEELEVSANNGEYAKAKADGTFIKPISAVMDALSGDTSTVKILRYAVQRTYEGEDDIVGTPTLVDGQFVYRHDIDGVDGKAIIEQKLEETKTYLLENYGIPLDDLRHEVLTRTYVTKPDGEFVKDNGQYVNRLTWPTNDGKTTVMDSLRYQVKQYENESNVSNE